MNEFTKNKIAFAVALLAALFTITPILGDIGSWGFDVFSLTIQVFHLYCFLSGILTLAVYIYGLQFLAEHQFKQLQVAGDIFYAIALVSPPFYLSIYLLTLVINLLAKLLQVPFAAEILTNILSSIISALAVLLVEKIAKTFGRKDRQARVENIQKEEDVILIRAKRLLNDGCFDLAIVECFKVIELALRKALIARDIQVGRTNPRVLMEKARHQELISPELFERVDALRDLRNSISHSREDISFTQLQAEQALATTGKILAAIESSLEQNSFSETERRFESKIEKEAFEVLSNLSGKEIPGSLLSSESNVIMPIIKRADEPYEIDSFVYYGNFQGTNHNGSKWIIEVKSAYMQAGDYSLIDRLSRIQNESPKIKSWLIVVEKIPKTIKERAIRNGIYFTDVASWEEIKNLSK